MVINNFLWFIFVIHVCPHLISSNHSDFCQDVYTLQPTCFRRNAFVPHEHLCFNALQSLNWRITLLDLRSLRDRPGRKGPLTWTQRLKIAVDVARGLNYLHFDRAVPHGNLKATNILLDGPDLNARIADYSLHRLMTQASILEQILDAGILGYCAPELAAAKKPSPSFKSDVYAFGVILLELLTGRCAVDVVRVSDEEGGGEGDLTGWVRLRVAQGHGPDCFDVTLALEIANPAVAKGMKEVLGIALRCIRPVSERRGIKSVYEELSSV